MTYEKPALQVHDPVDHGIRILEEERRRIARDLHDGPAQRLTNISMKLDILKRMLDANPEMAKSQVEQLHDQVGTVIGEIRHLIYDLRPLAIDEIGLFESINVLCSQLQQNWQIPIQLEIDGHLKSEPIAPAKQVALYRLIQEVLNNIHKHAEAQKVTIHLARTQNILEMDIVDDGIGFNPAAIPAGHYGLLGMKERANYLGGTLDITSILGEGSRFKIRVPVFSNE